MKKGTAKSDFFGSHKVSRSYPVCSQLVYAVQQEGYRPAWGISLSLCVAAITASYIDLNRPSK